MRDMQLQTEGFPPILGRWATCLLLLGLMLGLGAPLVYATHGLAGEITYTYVPNPSNPSLPSNTYRIRLTTYTNPCAANVDRCNINIEVWAVVGSGRVRQNYPELTNIPRSNGSPITNCTRGGVILRQLPNGAGCVRYNIYEATVTFRGSGVFELRYSDPTRIANVTNMSNSVAVNWAVQTLLFNIASRGINNSPQLLNAPIDDACTNKLWTHNPGAFDPDGDSLSYRLLESQTYNPDFNTRLINCPGYQFPDRFPVSPLNQFTIDPRTGVVTWQTPQAEGIYNFAIRVIEWRNGVAIGEVIRDVAVIVGNCRNNPPDIRAPLDLCARPGQTVTFPVRVYDPDSANRVLLYLNSGVEGVSETFRRGARLIPPNDTSLRPQLIGTNPPVNPVPTTFFAIDGVQYNWPIECADIRSRPWQVQFYANDDFARTDGLPTLADNHVTLIRVLGPPVTGLMAATGMNRSINLIWSAASCNNVVGYEIYSSADSSAAPLDTCCGGFAEEGGFTRIATVNGRLNTSFIHGPDLPFRGRYCYRVAPLYRDSVAGRNVRGCFSEIVCVRQERDFPVLLRNDVDETSPTTGRILTRWRQPNYARINPSFFPRPYTYTLLRADGVGGTNFTALASGIAELDTTRTINPLNTVVGGHNLRVDLFDAMGREISRSDPASSIFLTVSPANQALNLSFESRTGWVNTQYTIYRGTTLGGPMLPIATVTTTGQNTVTYTDRNLAPGVQLCYYVESSGSYNNPAVHIAPLINRSNRACGIPIDTVPPCPPRVSSEVSCEDARVTLRFTPDPGPCDDDLRGYIIYYKPTRDLPDDAFVIRDTLLSSESSFPNYEFTDAAGSAFIGCYAFATIDTATPANISRRSEPICLGNDCPLFALPNVFTPNGDGQNDRFIPLSYDPFSSRFVRGVTCWIYDRTGRLISTSTNKDNLWDGHFGTSPAAEGVYYYVVELILEGTESNRKVVRTGSVTLLR